MQLDDLTLEVRDRDLNRVGVILPRDALFTLRNDYCNVGQWAVTVPLEHPMVPALRTPGAGIIATVRKTTVLLSGPVVSSSSTGSSDAPEGMVTFTGVTDDIALADALAWPVPSSDTMAGQSASESDQRTGPVESVLHGFVNANIGPGAPASRRKARLVMGSNAGRGPTITKAARFDVLGTLLNEAAATSDVGFEIVQSGQQLVFRTYQVADRTKTIRMDLWNNTLAAYDFQMAGAALTRAIVGGKGEGKDRVLVEQASAESLAQEALWGRRIEQFLDRRSEEELDRLKSAANEVLAEKGIGQSAIKFTPMDDSTMEFLVDWFLGDRVTAVIEGREITAIAQACIVVVDEKGLRVQVALGDSAATVDQVAAAARAIEQRIDSLERLVDTAAPGTPSSPEGARITAGSNLNAYLEPGLYTLDDPLVANTVRNLPVPPIPAPGTANVTPGAVRQGSIGALRVTTTDTRVVHEFTHLITVGTNRLTYKYARMRGGDGVTWGPWTLGDTPTSIFTTAEWDSVGKQLGATAWAPHSIRRVGQEYVPATYWTLDGNTWINDVLGRPVDSPCWLTGYLDSPWGNYANGFATAQYMRTREGIVLLRGLIRSGSPGAKIFTLPAGYRPAIQRMYAVSGADPTSGQAGRVDVLPNGDVILRSLGSGTTGYLSLASIIFPNAGVAPASAWTPLALQNGWTDFALADSSWGPAASWTDQFGRLWLTGLVRRTSIPAADSAIVTLPATTDRHNHMGTLTGAGFSGVGWVSNVLIYKTGSADFLALPTFPLIPTATAPYNVWDTFTLGSSWTNYDATGNGFPPAGLWRAPDGIVHYRGLITSSTPGTNIHGGLTPGMRPSLTAGIHIFPVSAGNAHGRIDLSGGGMSGSTTTGAAGWRSLDGIFFLKEA